LPWSVSVVLALGQPVTTAVRRVWNGAKAGIQCEGRCMLHGVSPREKCHTCVHTDRSPCQIRYRRWLTGVAAMAAVCCGCASWSRCASCARMPVYPDTHTDRRFDSGEAKKLPGGISTTIHICPYICPYAHNQSRGKMAYLTGVDRRSYIYIYTEGGYAPQPRALLHHTLLRVPFRM
jgi:hypothetical protein